MGAVNSLPEDLQWAIRMLLPRRQDVTATAPETATKPADALCQIVSPTAYLPYMLQPQQLAVLTQHAQQVAHRPFSTIFVVIQNWLLHVHMGSLPMHCLCCVSIHQQQQYV